MFRGYYKKKIRAISGNFLTELWPEVYKITVYLANKTP